MMTDDQVSEATGLQMYDAGLYWSVGETESLGGLRCTWWERDNYGGAIAVVTVMPAILAPQGLEGRVECDIQVRKCSAGFINETAWFTVWFRGGGIDGVAAATENIADTVMANALQFAPPTVPELTEATWSRSYTCDGLAASLTSPDYPERQIIAQPGDPSPQGTRPELNEVVGGTCWFEMPSGASTSGYSHPITVVIVPSGAVAYDAGVASGKGTPVDFAYGKAAQVVAPFVFEGVEGLFATDGTNTLLIEVPMGQDVSAYVWLAEQIFVTLSAA